MVNRYIALGAIIGDICGSKYEFNNYQPGEMVTYFDGCWVTDDTVHTLAAMVACIYAKRRVSQDDHKTFCLALGEGMHKALAKMYKLYPNVSYGAGFRQVAKEGLRPYNSYGNGAAMRVSPVAFIARNEQEVLDYAKAVTEVTHNHPEGIKGAQAVALACYMARAGQNKNDILQAMDGFYEIPEYNTLLGNYSFDETCQGTVPQALSCFFKADTFAETVRKSIILGGDTDTIAAIACSIAAIYYPVPTFFGQSLRPFLDGTMRSIITKFYSIIDDRTMYKCQNKLFED